MRVLICDLSQQDGNEVEVCGWVHKIRKLGAIIFLVLRDRSGIVQVVYRNKQISLHLESVVSIKGIVKKNQKALGGYEIEETHTFVFSLAQADLPFLPEKDINTYNLESILDHRLLSLRNIKIRGIFELEATILSAFSTFLRNHKFTEIKTSKIIGRGTEGGTELFEIDYFGKPLYLTQSPQFYKQAMVASGLERVYECAPVYRAEKHETRRHLSEYVSLDMEMAFIKDEHELMDLQHELLEYVFQEIKQQHDSVLKMWNVLLPSAKQWASVPRLTYAEAKELLRQILGKTVFDIQPDGERALCDWAAQKYDIEAVFIYAFPRKKRPFYTYFEETLTRSFDLLFRGQEISTGGQRIHERDRLEESIVYFHLDPASLKDYLSIFSAGCPPHGGFAIGLERFAQQILHLENVKEAAAFPRDRKRISP